jgi:hypothetical protein
MPENFMTLHVDSSTIRNQGVLAHVLDPVDGSTDSDSPAQGSSSSSTDSAAISTNGLRLASIGIDHSDELNGIADAEALVRSFSASISSNSTGSASLHGSIDRGRAAALLVD